MFRSQDELVIRHELPANPDYLVQIDRRGKSKAKPKPVAAPKPAVTKRPTTTKAPGTSPAKPTTKPVAAVKPVPFKRTPKSLKGYDICLIPGFECIDDVSTVGALAQGPVKRDGDARNFDAQLSVGVVKLRSKSYWSSGQLFVKGTTSLNLKEAWADYKTDNVKNYHVELASAKIAARGSTYVTEHIVEVRLLLNLDTTTFD